MSGVKMEQQYHNPDINDIIISGIDKDKLQSIIDENTYTGPVATLKLNMWKKI